MEETELRKYIENDNFLDIAYERYEKFKLTDNYGEQYKFDILSKLNEYFAERTIDEKNVVEIARKIEKSNPRRERLLIGDILMILLILSRNILTKRPGC